jgi:hypothetical protein
LNLADVPAANFRASAEKLSSSACRWQESSLFPKTTLMSVPCLPREFRQIQRVAGSWFPMQQFEPFGENVSWRDREPQQSRALKWVGVGIFWLLAGTIVVARAAYFNPDIYNGFDRALAFAQHLVANI